jgi:hypothetical protein
MGGGEFAHVGRRPTARKRSNLPARAPRRGAIVVVTSATVDEVVREPDPVLRNLRISVTYARLAREFAELVGPRDAPWVQFATWTSEDVGLAIRGQQTERRWFLRLVRRLRRDYEALAARASAAFSAGNTDVFGHVGRSFVGFHDALRAEAPDAVERFVAGLDPQRHGGGAIPEVGLADAFGAYADAATADDDGRRARSVALGNLALAVIEQSRVQPQIEETFTLFAEGLPSHPRVRRLVGRLVTELALEVTMGDVHVRPGRGLPPGLAVPPDLVALVRHDDRFGAYRSLLPPEPPDSDRWMELADRVTFIAALMPLLQQSPRLLGTAPFTDEEMAAIEAGDVPDRFRPQGRR